MASILELQDLYNEALVREIIEKSKSCGLVWGYLGGTQFSATETDLNVEPNIIWNLYITKTQIGNLTYKYTLDIKKNLVSYININDGPFVHTSRDSAVKDLYEIIEIIVMELDKKLKETLRFVQQVETCRE